MSGMDENLELLWSDSLSLEMAKLKPEEVEARGVREGGRTELGVSWPGSSALYTLSLSLQR